MGLFCKICNSVLFFHDKSLILNTYTVIYYFCKNCGFVQTEEPYWLNESYSSAIASADTGIMLRTLKNANDLLFLLQFAPPVNSIFLDFGGGHGVLARIMRDYGFDFYHYDKYAENLFARGFEADLSKKYTAITAYENFEHFTTPLEEIEKLLKITDTIIFSTSLISYPPPLVKDWWYYAPATGQHISFYSQKTLQVIAEKYNLYLQSNNSDLHILSKLPFRKNIFYLLGLYNKAKNKLDISRKLKRKSKCWDDMLKVLDMP